MSQYVSDQNTTEQELEDLDPDILKALAYDINRSMCIDTKAKDYARDIAGHYQYDNGILVPREKIRLAERIEEFQQLKAQGKPLRFTDRESVIRNRNRATRRPAQYARLPCREGWERVNPDDVRCRKSCVAGFERPAPDKPCKKAKGTTNKKKASGIRECPEGKVWKPSTKRCVNGPKGAKSNKYEFNEAEFERQQQEFQEEQDKINDAEARWASDQQKRNNPHPSNSDKLFNAAEFQKQQDEFHQGQDRRMNDADARWASEMQKTNNPHHDKSQKFEFNEAEFERQQREFQEEQDKINAAEARWASAPQTRNQPHSSHHHRKTASPSEIAAMFSSPGPHHRKTASPSEIAGVFASPSSASSPSTPVVSLSPDNIGRRSTRKAAVAQRQLMADLGAAGMLHPVRGTKKRKHKKKHGKNH